MMKREVEIGRLTFSEAGLLLVLILWGIGVCVIDGVRMISLKIGRLVSWSKK